MYIFTLTHLYIHIRTFALLSIIYKNKERIANDMSFDDSSEASRKRQLSAEQANIEQAEVDIAALKGNNKATCVLRIERTYS